MAFFKCKMCGGDLDVSKNATIAECEYCGTKQTVPKAVDENLQNLFNRANTLRMKCEFDKAEKLYEKIVQMDSAQPDAYWGLILCKYGIEYVEDPATLKRIPTCHRASYDSIIADEDFKSVLKHADVNQRAIYEQQAKEIDRIQKDILALAKSEENYDVFICYKETDENGKRTQDSVIANDIYYQLTQEGLKVFYAAITLEGKLGSAYEPIIFAALNSAKVMLVIGTKSEYFNAVWVKNEWSRYLKIIKQDRSKLLIPCYRDMDAYELPEEFAHLQAQDMSKIGFINDIVRGIKKVVVKETPKPTVEVREPVVVTTGTNVAPLLKRAFMFLEDGEFNRANECFETVLNQDPENAQAYLGKLMIDMCVHTKEQLANCVNPLDSSKHFTKVMRFADSALRAKLNSYNENIRTRISNERKDTILAAAIKDVNSNNIDAWKQAVETLESLQGWKDADHYLAVCRKKIDGYASVEKFSKKYARFALLGSLGIIFSFGIITFIASIIKQVSNDADLFRIILNMIWYVLSCIGIAFVPHRFALKYLFMNPTDQSRNPGLIVKTVVSAILISGFAGIVALICFASIGISIFGFACIAAIFLNISAIVYIIVLKILQAKKRNSRT